MAMLVKASPDRARLVATVTVAPSDTRLFGDSHAPESQPRSRSDSKSVGVRPPAVATTDTSDSDTASGRGVAAGFVPGPGCVQTGHRT
jgi:hypothetical protein